MIPKPPVEPEASQRNMCHIRCIYTSYMTSMSYMTFGYMTFNQRRILRTQNPGSYKMFVAHLIRHSVYVLYEVLENVIYDCGRERHIG